MKKLLTLLLFCAVASGVYAQSGARRSQQQRRQTYEYILHQLLPANTVVGQLQKPTELGQRLTGIKFLDNIEGGPAYREDTTRLYYSGLRTSTFNYATMEYYTEPHSFDAPLAEGLSIMPAGTTEVNPDSLIQEGNSGFLIRQKLQYLSGNLRARQTVAYANGNETSYIAGYDNSQHITRLFYYSHSTDDTIANRSILYNTAYTRIIADTIYARTSLTPAAFWIYDYYSTDRIKELVYVSVSLTGVQTPVEKYTFTYYPDNKLQTITAYTIEIDDELYPDQADSFSYEGTNPIYKGRHSRTYGPYGTPHGPSSEIKHFNSNGHPDTVYYYIGGGFDPAVQSLASRYVITYNSFKNPVSKVYYEGSIGTNIFRIKRYYYQDFETKIDAYGAEQAAFSIYPNPSPSGFFLVWKGDHAISDAVITITDYLGRELIRLRQPLKPGNNLLDASRLPQGNYLLGVRDENGLKIVRKLVRI